MNSEKQIDCQGLPCPQPVLKCKEVVEQDKPLILKVLVDNDPALENVSRFLSLNGYHLHKPEKSGTNWQISASRKSDPVKNEDQQKHTTVKIDQDLERILVFISSDKIGQGDNELSTKLMLNFLATLPEMESLWTVVFVNSGVK
ncbi:MAG: sulfurtransferase-like selenium metabolism protein YedF, partial [Desulfovibrionales bacterium]|nr:sulfurtransferase-like selenium metabolism protein YedF [Desulfovibrionales bacterium]